MSIFSKLFKKDIDSVQTTFNEDSIDELGGESENVISNTKEITKERE